MYRTGWVIELSAAMSPVLEYDSILSQTDVDCSNQVAVAAAMPHGYPMASAWASRRKSER